MDFYVPFVTGIIPSDKYNYTKEELEMIHEHKYWSRGTHFGDPAGRFKNAVVEATVLDVLKNNGIIVNYRDEWKEWSRRKNSAKRRILDGIKMHKNDRTKYFNVCMLNASYPKVRAQGVEEVRSIKPKHDYTSHYRSAFEYLCLGLEQTEQRQVKVYDKFPQRKAVSITRGGRKISGY